MHIANTHKRWLVILGLLLLHAVLLVAFRDKFNHERQLAEYPALWLAAGLVSAGIVFLFLVRLIRNTADNDTTDTTDTTRLLALIVAGGLLMRVLLLWSTPALEDDFYRYLWDGGVTANGYSPYNVPPAAAEAEQLPKPFRDLADDAGHIRDRINHPK